MSEPVLGATAPVAQASPTQGTGKNAVSPPVEVAPGVVQQKQGDKTLTSTTQMIGAGGQAMPLSVPLDLPLFSPKDFKQSSYVVRPSKANRGNWSEAKEYTITGVEDGDTVRGNVPG